MGEISCDILTGENLYCVFVRYVNTTHQRITGFKPPVCFDGNFNQNVCHVIFYKATLPIFPRELGEFFPNLKYIDIFECELERIDKEDLRGFPKLERLKMQGNKLRFLPGDLFEHTPNISHINLSKNRIVQIAPNIFDSCKELIKVNLRGNEAIDFYYHCDTLDIEALKFVIERDCKPMKQLWELAATVVSANISVNNVEDIYRVGKNLGIEMLRTQAEKFMKCKRNAKN